MEGTAVFIEQLTAEAEAAWDAYVDAHPQSTCYHLRAWRTVAEHAYRLWAPWLVARPHPGGPICGVLPIFVVRGLLRSYVTSGLFGAYGPILADDPETGRALVQSAQGITEAEGASYLLLKSLGHEPLASGFSRRDTCVIATLPLPDDPETLWRSFRDKIRNLIRKGQKSGLEVRTGPGELDGYYDVLAENMHRKGTPIYGIDFMRSLVGALGERAEIVALHQGDLAVAAALVIYHGRVANVPFASSRPGALRLASNNLLYWEIMKRACARGMKVLDFGRSPRDATTLTFKLGWGASVTPMPFYVYTARGRPPRLDASNAAVQFLVRLWRRLPRPVADALGPSVCSHFLA